MKALIAIDYTNDFVATDGALTCGAPGQAIEEEIVRLTRKFVEAGDFVVFAVDVHELEDDHHPETRLYPPHNIRGTAGRQLYGKLGELYKEIKDRPNVYFMDKTRYSAFSGTDLDLKLRAKGITELHFVGVATDICVLHSLYGAYERGYDLVVHKKGVASFNPAGHEFALQHFQNSLGAEVR
ncbi:cysteine hydrolase [Alkalihalobacillus oceani]|uniref:Cysteine hydrolase n=1 Tax=Halalkalibacter oceani TaxID=1653776 RepID=A0A9X2DQ66_9BACI|nr:isochorismatase family cysteine hydrolase [Halalkalibacter oceani]MCM3713352.1 cysteine hydrolase [Halalkalibacter oceani]